VLNVHLTGRESGRAGVFARRARPLRGAPLAALDLLLAASGGARPVDRYAARVAPPGASACRPRPTVGLLASPPGPGFAVRRRRRSTVSGRVGEGPAGDRTWRRCAQAGQPDCCDAALEQGARPLLAGRGTVGTAAVVRREAHVARPAAASMAPLCSTGPAKRASMRAFPRRSAKLLRTPVTPEVAGSFSLFPSWDRFHCTELGLIGDSRRPFGKQKPPSSGGFRSG
jgi:hypothetical protein